MDSRPHAFFRHPLRFLHAFLRHPLSFVGTVLATVSATLFLVLVGIQLAGFSSSSYLGIITFLILPAVLVLGLVLIPLGQWRAHKRHQRATAAGQELSEYPVLDFNRPVLRNIALGLTSVTAINVAILSVGTYKGVQVMHTSEFCGATCHTPMNPEHTAYLDSPHARVECVECHVGSGADHFVKAKLNGVSQLFAVMWGNYARPIHTPVKNLRPANETCGSCHSPDRFVPDKLHVLTHFAADAEANTRRSTVMLSKVGGLQDGKWKGVHSHLNPERSIRYLGDEKRRTIHTVELTQEDGTVKSFQSPGAPAPGPDAAWRTMDCTDCHSRPAHAFRSAEEELDAALARELISPELPWVKRESLLLLQSPYSSHEQARQQLAQGLEDFYAKEYPEVASEQAESIKAAGSQLGRIYARNVFPDMKIDWGTYPDFRNHEGCFRCHDNEHVTSDGGKIAKKCGSCHEVVATDEEDPEALQVLYP